MKGGKREGAGRKKGAPNKATAQKRAEVAASGLMPVDYMLSIMRDARQTDPVRMDAAKAVAPYLHPKLANIEHTGPDGGAIKVHMIKGDEDL